MMPGMPAIPGLAAIPGLPIGPDVLNNLVNQALQQAIAQGRLPNMPGPLQPRHINVNATINGQAVNLTATNPLYRAEGQQQATPPNVSQVNLGPNQGLSAATPEGQTANANSQTTVDPATPVPSTTTQTAESPGPAASGQPTTAPSIGQPNAVPHPQPQPAGMGLPNPPSLPHMFNMQQQGQQRFTMTINSNTMHLPGRSKSLGPHVVVPPMYALSYAPPVRNTRYSSGIP